MTSAPPPDQEPPDQALPDQALPDQAPPSNRVVLFTGKGGVGKSTVAAGTAALAAAQGRRTLLVSTDPAHSLADVLDAPVGSEPTEVAPHLHAQQVDAQDRLEQAWGETRRYLVGVLDLAGVDPVTAEELTVVPGAEEVLALLEVRRHLRSPLDDVAWDVVVVDCAPTGETLRLLALPEVLGWYLGRLRPAQRRVLRALRPLLDRATGVPAPDEEVVDTLTRLRTELAEVRDLLTGPTASVRVVMTPETVVLAEARRAWTTLALYGYRVDGVVANRVFPPAPDDPWRTGWVSAQAEVLARVEESFAGLPLWRADYRPSEPVGAAALRDLAHDLYEGTDPWAPPTGPEPFRVARTPGGAELRLALPFATRADVDLARVGDDLVVTLRGPGVAGAGVHGARDRSVGACRRLLTLPAVLARLHVAGASVSDGELRVRFRDGDRERQDR